MAQIPLNQGTITPPNGLASLFVSTFLPMLSQPLTGPIQRELNAGGNYLNATQFPTIDALTHAYWRNYLTLEGLMEAALWSGYDFKPSGGGPYGALNYQILQSQKPT